MEKSANKKSTPSRSQTHSQNNNNHNESQESVENLENVDNKMILYEILGVQQTATVDEIKKAYRRLALLKHPDKNPNDEKASENFQKLQKAYQILSDPKKRERYDQYGDDGENGGDVFSTDDWLTAYEYYRTLHPEVTKKDVKDFSQRYRFSKDEEEDLLQYYVDHDGDVTHILENIICSVNDDVQRFVDFYEKMIKEGEIDDCKLFQKTKKKISLLPDEKEEAKKEKNKIKAKQAKTAKDAGVSTMADLEKMILAKKQTGFNGFLNYMTDKYAEPDAKKKSGKSKGGKKNEDDWEDDEEEDVDMDAKSRKNLNKKRIQKSKQEDPPEERSAQKKRRMN